MSLIKVEIEQICNGCEKSVVQIKKRYKGQKYCSTCYARIFKKCLCPECGLSARLPKNDDQAICNECIKKKPCIRCNMLNKPIGKLTEYGVVCNSCSVYFREIERCERCNVQSQKLSKISRFNDDLRVCPKCSTRDYETCPSCHKYRLLELDQSGKKLCKKCRTQPNKPCLECKTLISAGCADLCDHCYWRKNLWVKFDQNIHLFESVFLKKQYENYVYWLAESVGEHQAALYLNKHTHFFIKTEVLWTDEIPNADQLLQILRASGLRKFELVVQWLDQIHGVKISSMNKNECSEIDQANRLIEQLPQPSLAFDVVCAYKQKLDEKRYQGKTSIRSVRLAIKPAVALMLSIQDHKILPNLEKIKAYLSKYSGQAAALTGFINFLNNQYNTNIDYLSLKNSQFVKEASKHKLENELISMISHDNDFDVLAWVKKGLQFFHKMSYQDALKIKIEMIVESKDGYNISFNNQDYWLPKKH